VTEDATGVGHNRRGGGKERRPRWRGRLHHQHVARLESAGSGQRANDARAVATAEPYGATRWRFRNN
jgi:hypothetical protein